HGFIGYPFDYRVTLGFGSIAGGIDHVNPVIRLPLKHRIRKEEFNDFFALYNIPPAYHVILPKSNQIVFDAPHGYVGLYTHSFSLENLSDPILFLAGLQSSWEHGQTRLAILVRGKEMAFRNFFYDEDEEDLSFLPKEPSLGFGTGSAFVLVNAEPLRADEEPVLQPAEVMIDFRGSPKHE
nr:hypothetical protein [Tanacetum cinerariifolium]